MQRNNNNCSHHVQLHSCWFGITLLQHTPIGTGTMIISKAWIL